MDKRNLKIRLVEECKKLQSKTFNTLNEVVMEAQQTANEYEGGVEGNFDSFREEMQHKREIFEKQLRIQTDEMGILHKIDATKEYETVQFGSVVETELQTLFISISLGKVVLDGKTYFAISTLTPLFKAMIGKKKGDSYTFNGATIELKDVF